MECRPSPVPSLTSSLSRHPHTQAAAETHSQISQHFYFCVLFWSRHRRYPFRPALQRSGKKACFVDRHIVANHKRSAAFDEVGVRLALPLEIALRLWVRGDVGGGDDNCN